MIDMGDLRRGKAVNAVHAVADALRLPRRARPVGADRDLHEIDAILADAAAVEDILERPIQMRGFGLQPHRGRVIKGMGRVWDYRHLTVPNGGPITVLGQVQHIPVIRQMTGRADLDVLWRVLVQQGLMVQHATDGEGNVALYTDPNRLCYHARGANSVTAGVEHMHATTSEKWSNKQLNAAAYCAAILRYEHGVPLTRAVLAPGRGQVTVRKRGQMSHEAVSAAAGYHDRSDPGAGYPWDEVRARAMFFRRHGNF